MSVERLDLDFVRRRKPLPASWLLLAIALAFAADLAWTWQKLRTETSRAEQRLGTKREDARPGEMLRVALRPPRDGEMAAARDTVRRLSVPWPALFGALEAAQTDGAWLLSIEPDAQNAVLVLTGEARDYLSALSYVANLERQKALSAVHLSKHETRANEPQKPLAFTISASWKAAR